MVFGWLFKSFGYMLLYQGFLMPVLFFCIAQHPSVVVINAQDMKNRAPSQNSREEK